MVETRSGRRFAVFFLLAAFLVLLLGRFVRPVDHAALTISAPFSSAINGVANWVAGGISGVLDGPRIREENIQLTKKLGQYERTIIQDEQARHENELLRRMVGFQSPNGGLNLLSVKFIGTDVNRPLAPYSVINRGSRDGLRAGMTVLDQNGYFVGRIDDLGSNWARVQLMLSPSLSVGALDMRSRAPGLVEGVYAGSPQLVDVAGSASLRVGDLILTSGQWNLFPSGILLGKVTQVQHSNVEPLETAVVQPAANFDDLELGMVVRHQDPAIPARLVPSP